MTDHLTRTMTADYADELIRAARAKERTTLLDWAAFHYTFRPGTTPAPVLVNAGVAAQVERHGGQNSEDAK